MRTEIAVIGSGPGGAITACILAEAGRKVLIIEEGAGTSQIPCSPFSSEELKSRYRNGGLTPTLGKTKVTYAEGCCLGGGSEINSGLYHRTPVEVLNRWTTEFQVEGISPEEMEPHFAAAEHDLSIEYLSTPAPPASLKLVEGADKLGWKSIEVPRWFKYTEKGYIRNSMTRTYLPRATAAGAEIFSGAVLQLRWEGKSWTIHVRDSAGKRIAVSAEAVFLCAGAVQTPAILRRSGIRSNIGNSLRMHPTVKIVAEFPEEVNAAGAGVPVHQVKEFAPALSFGCSISSPGFLATGLLHHVRNLRKLRETWKKMAVYYAMILSETTGKVRCLPAQKDPLVIYPLSQIDLQQLASGLRKLGRLLFEAGAVRLFPGMRGLNCITQPQDLSIIPAILPPGKTDVMTIHLFSSCPMGEDRRKCATDSFGKVRGVPQLWINDASLLCTAPGVNPQGSIMAQARRIALHALTHLSSGKV